MKFFTYPRVSSNENMNENIPALWREYESYVASHPELRERFDPRLLDPMFLHDGLVISIDFGWVDSPMPASGPMSVVLVMSDGSKLALLIHDLDRAWVNYDDAIIIDRMDITNFDILHGECTLSEEVPEFVELRLLSDIGVWACLRGKRVTIDLLEPAPQFEDGT